MEKNIWRNCLISSKWSFKSFKIWSSSCTCTFCYTWFNSICTHGQSTLWWKFPKNSSWSNNNIRCRYVIAYAKKRTINSTLTEILKPKFPKCLFKQYCILDCWFNLSRINLTYGRSYRFLGYRITNWSKWWCWWFLIMFWSNEID